MRVTSEGGRVSKTHQLRLITLRPPRDQLRSRRRSQAARRAVAMETAGLPPTPLPRACVSRCLRENGTGETRSRIPRFAESLSPELRKTQAGRTWQGGRRRNDATPHPPPPCGVPPGDSPSRWVCVAGEGSTNCCSFGPCWKSCRCKSRAVFSLSKGYTLKVPLARIYPLWASLFCTGQAETNA